MSQRNARTQKGLGVSCIFTASFPMFFGRMETRGSAWKSCINLAFHIGPFQPRMIASVFILVSSHSPRFYGSSGAPRTSSARLGRLKNAKNYSIRGGRATYRGGLRPDCRRSLSLRRSRFIHSVRKCFSLRRFRFIHSIRRLSTLQRLSIL